MMKAGRWLKTLLSSTEDPSDKFASHTAESSASDEEALQYFANQLTTYVELLLVNQVRPAGKPLTYGQLRSIEYFWCIKGYKQNIRSLLSKCESVSHSAHTATLFETIFAVADSLEDVASDKTVDASTLPLLFLSVQVIRSLVYNQAEGNPHFIRDNDPNDWRECLNTAMAQADITPETTAVDASEKLVSSLRELK